MIPGRGQRWFTRTRLADGLFFCVLLLFCAVVAEGRFFPTVDGPVHSYNARLLGDLLGGDAHSTAFFELNNAPAPYWTSMVFMWLFGIVLGPSQVERAMVLLIIITIAFAFRSFLRAAGAKSAAGHLLIFPFIWTVPLQLGFFNFCLGLALLLFVLGWWLRRTDDWTTRRMIVGMSLFVFLYFTHLMLFTMAILLMTATAFWSGWKERSVGIARMQLKRILLLSLPGLVLCTWYFAVTGGEGPKAAAFPFTQRVEWLLNAQPLLTLVWDQEQPMARLVQAGLLILSGAALWHRRKSRAGSPVGDVWGLVAFLLFASCLVLPDGFASGTIVLVRLQLLGLILWAVWCGLQPMHAGLRVGGTALVIAGALWHLHFHRDALRSLRAEAEDLYTVHAAIGKDATVLPLNYSDNWLHGNFSDYLGMWKNTIVLDNFVARYAHAPIRWRAEMEPFTDVGNFDSSLQPCVHLAAWTARTGRTLDHVITVRMPEQPSDSCTIDARRQLRDHYDLVFTSPSGTVELFTLKRRTDLVP